MQDMDRRMYERGVPLIYLAPDTSPFPKAKLFYEEHELKMVTTRPIKAGEQIVMIHVLSRLAYCLTWI